MQVRMVWGVWKINISKRITWIQPYYDIILNLIPINASTILDIGAGNGIFGFILKKTRDAKIIAVEPFNYDLSFYDRVYNSSWQDWIGKDILVHSCLIALEVIEHMDKQDALHFLNAVKSIAKKVIISTPYVFQQQDEYDNNPLQVHRCKITIDDFTNRKYKVYIYGVINLKLISIRFFANSRLERLLKPFITNIIGVYDNWILEKNI